jgi:hypothetical protein
MVQVSNRTPISGNCETSIICGTLWHEHKVRVHTTHVKRGRAVARCSLDDVPTCRILEVPFWMLDAAACCQIRTAESSVVDVESLRELILPISSSR